METLFHHLSSSAVHCPLTKLEEELLLFTLLPLGSFPSLLETTLQLKFFSRSPPFLSWVKFIDSPSTRNPSTKLMSWRHGKENPLARPWVEPQGPSPKPNGDTNLSHLFHQVWIWVCKKLLELESMLPKGSNGGG